MEIIKISENDVGKVIYVCRTQSGRFHFDKSRDGEYEIRVSLEGHDQTTVRIAIAKAPQSSKEISIPMRVGA